MNLFSVKGGLRHESCERILLAILCVGSMFHFNLMHYSLYPSEASDSLLELFCTSVWLTHFLMFLPLYTERKQKRILLFTLQTKRQDCAHAHTHGQRQEERLRSARLASIAAPAAAAFPPLAHGFFPPFPPGVPRPPAAPARSCSDTRGQAACGGKRPQTAPSRLPVNFGN